MKPFSEWSEADVKAHNERVSGVISQTSLKPQPMLTTNLVPTKTTDEEKLNKLERDWLRQLRLTHPEVGVQNITLKLADDTRYTADFNVVDANGQIVFYETKGFFRDDAKVKIKVAARSFLHFRFILVTREKGQWVEKPVNP